MAAGRDAASHAGTIYRRTFGWLRHPVREIEAEAEHLHKVEEAGESGVTPFIAIAGIVLFLLPIVLLVLGLAFAAYFIAR
jgi:Xaa-Pro aminopeptidase